MVATPLKELQDMFGPHRTRLPVSCNVQYLAQRLHYVSHDTHTQFLGDDNDIINDARLLFE